MAGICSRHCSRGGFRNSKIRMKSEADRYGRAGVCKDRRLQGQGVALDLRRQLDVMRKGENGKQIGCLQSRRASRESFFASTTFHFSWPQGTPCMGRPCSSKCRSGEAESSSTSCPAAL